MIDLDERGPGFTRFWTERRVAVLAIARPGRAPHAAPVGVTLDIPTGVARVITSGTTVKARLVRAAGEAGLAVALTQVDGRWWSTLEGRAVLRTDAESVADAERRYAQRYRQPRINPRRVVIQVTISRALGNQ